METTGDQGRALTMGRVDPRVFAHITTKRELLYILVCVLLAGFDRELDGGRVRVARVMSQFTSTESIRRARKSLMESGWISEDEAGVVRVHDDGERVERDTTWWADKYWTRPALKFKAQWVLQVAHTLTAMELRLLMLLLFVGNKSKTSWHGTRMMASHLRASPRTVQRARAGLKKRGLLITHQRGPCLESTVVEFEEQIDVAKYERALVARVVAAEPREELPPTAEKPTPIALSEELREFVVGQRDEVQQSCPPQTTGLSTSDHKAVTPKHYKPRPENQGDSSSRACAPACEAPKTDQKVKKEAKGKRSTVNTERAARALHGDDVAIADKTEALVVKGLRLIASAHDMVPALAPYVRRALKHVKPCEILARAQLYYVGAEYKLPLHRWLASPIRTWRMRGRSASALRREARQRALDWWNGQTHDHKEVQGEGEAFDSPTTPAQDTDGVVETSNPTKLPELSELNDEDKPALNDETLVRVIWYPKTAAPGKSRDELTRRADGRLGWVKHLYESDWPKLTLEQKRLLWFKLPQPIRDHARYRGEVCVLFGRR